MKTAILGLFTLVAALGYLRVTDSKDVQREIERNPQLAPHATYHVQRPPVGEDEILLERLNMDKMIAALPPMLINGREIVTCP